MQYNVLIVGDSLVNAINGKHVLTEKHETGFFDILGGSYQDIGYTDFLFIK